MCNKIAEALVAPVEQRVVSKCADTLALTSRESRVSRMGGWCGIVFVQVAEVYSFPRLGKGQGLGGAGVVGCGVAFVPP